MADKAVPFFDPSDLLSLGGDWVVQEVNPNTAVQRAQGLGATGDEVASETYDSKTSGTIVYENHAANGNLTLPSVGEVKGGYHIDSIAIAYNPIGWPRMTIQFHSHDQNSHADASLNEYACSLTLPAGFGCPRAAGITITDADCGVRSVNYTLGCTHLDEGDETGDHLAGENRDGVETLAVEFTKNPAVLAGPVGWDQMSSGTANSNTAAETASYSWEHHVARTA